MNSFIFLSLFSTTYFCSKMNRLLLEQQVDIPLLSFSIILIVLFFTESLRFSAPFQLIPHTYGSHSQPTSLIAVNIQNWLLIFRFVQHTQYIECSSVVMLYGHCMWRIFFSIFVVVGPSLKREVCDGETSDTNRE